MDSSKQASKKRILVILVTFLELLNNFTLHLMMVITVILAEEFSKQKKVRYGYHICGNNSRKRARISDTAIESLVTSMEKLASSYENANDSIRELISCFKHEKEGAERRMRVIDELKLVEGLTDVERMRAGEIITKDQNQTDYFFSVPADLKKPLVDYILGNCSAHI